MTTSDLAGLLLINSSSCVCVCACMGVCLCVYGCVSVCELDWEVIGECYKKNTLKENPTNSYVQILCNVYVCCV